MIARLLRRLSAAVLLSTAATAVFASEVLARLDRFLEDVHSGRGEFTQLVRSSSGRKPQQSSGEFAFERPGRFRWVYQTPYPQQLVADGRRMWSYDVDLNQVTVKAVGDALGATPAAILAGKGELARNFELRDGGSQDGLDWVDARPLARDGSFTELRLGFSGADLSAMVIRDSFGQQTELRFTRFERNPSLSAELFRFVPPSGADVVGE